MKLIRISILLLSVIFFSCKQKTELNVYLNTRHKVGDHTEFERKKYINFHGNQTEAECIGTEPLDILLEDLDVYLGRDNETGNRDLQLIEEDPNRPGYPNITQMKALGEKSRKWYNDQTHLHKYESRNELITTTYVFPLFPSDSATDAGWVPANSEASGLFVGHHINEYYGDRDGIHGEPRPKYFEVVNEPMWHLVTTNDISTPKKIFEHHNIMANTIRSIVPDILIGGYCAAFPNFEENNFQRWHERHRLFLDMCSQNMDFLTMHTYDFPAFLGKQKYRRGGNLEATLDMVEQYTYMKDGKVLPWLITEVGAQLHDWYLRGPHPYRDWLFMTAANSQLMQYMEKPDRVLKVMPFIVLNGYWDPNHQPYPWSLFWKNSEGKWDNFTYYLKFYQLWADVNGTRAYTHSSNLDIQSQTYIDSNRVYTIVDNLTAIPQRITLNFHGLSTDQLDDFTIKHFHLVDSIPTLDTMYYQKVPNRIKIDQSATMILSYRIDQQGEDKIEVDERKYYATEYLKEIQDQDTLLFNINGVDIKTDGKAVLRLGLGRNHGKSLKPVVLVNDVHIVVPDNWRGDDQLDRDSFFGMREISVPYDILRKENEVKLLFDDESGYVSSVTLQVFHFGESLQ